MSDERGRPVAAVIGGGNGIGEAVCRLMHARGWSVAVADIDGAAARRVAGDFDGLALELDIANESAAERAADRIERDIGPVAALVVAAAAFQDIVPAEELPIEEWERILRINLTGTLIANKAFGRHMIRHGRGSIVNIASIAAFSSLPAEAYGASKAGVVHLTRSLAGEWGRAGVRVNAVSPGSTLVPRVEERLDSGRYAAHPGEFTAIGRIVEPNEVAEAVEFLASGRSSAITGQNIVVDAGWEVASTWAQFGGVRKF